MSYADRTPMAKFFDALAYEKNEVKVTHTKDKKGVHDSIHVKLSSGFAKFEKNDQKYEFVFNHQKQVINHDCFKAFVENFTIKS